MFGWLRKKITAPTPEDIKWGIIEKSLRGEPEQWEFQNGQYRLTHKGTGFTLWIANKDFGMAGSFNKDQWSKGQSDAGDVPSEAWAKRLWVAVKHIKEGTKPQDALAVVEAFEKHLGVLS